MPQIRGGPVKDKPEMLYVSLHFLCCHHDDERADGQPLSVVNDASRKVAVRIAHSTRLRVLAKEGRGTNGKGVERAGLDRVAGGLPQKVEC